MLCYRDRTFCPFWEDCADNDTCSRPATELVHARAKALGLPVALFGEKPNCFISAATNQQSEVQ